MSSLTCSFFSASLILDSRSFTRPRAAFREGFLAMMIGLVDLGGEIGRALRESSREAKEKSEGELRLQISQATAQVT